MRATAGFLIGLGVLCVAGPALADDANDVQHVDVNAVLQETYDSNVARSDAALAAIRGISQSDSIFSPSIALDVLLPLSRQALFLKGSLGYDFYARDRVLNSALVDLEGGARAKLRSCSATITGDYTSQQTDLQDLNLIATRNIVQDESVSLDGNCGGVVGFAPTLSVGGHWSQNSAVELLPSNFVQFSLSTGIAYRRPLFGELSLYFSYDNTAFPNRNLLVGPASIEDGYKDYAAVLKYDRRFGARIEGTVKVAYTSVSPDARSVAGFQGVTYGADITARFSSRLSAKLSLDRAVVPTIRPDTTYAVENIYSLEGDYSLGRRWKLVAGASDENDRYNGQLISGVDIASDDVWAVYGSVNYKFSRRLAIDLNARHEVRDANISAFSYTDTRVALSISAGI